MTLYYALGIAHNLETTLESDDDDRGDGVVTVTAVAVWFTLSYDYHMPDTSSHLVLTTTWETDIMSPPLQIRNLGSQ